MAFRPSLIPTLFVVPALIILGNLGFWQLGRHVEAESHLEEVEARLYGPPITTAEVHEVSDEDLGWRKATLEGQFTSDAPALLGGRFEFGASGYDVVQVFETTAGDRFLVNRGWIPSTDWQTHLAEVKTTPQETLTLEGLFTDYSGSTDLVPIPADGQYPERWAPETRNWLGFVPTRVGPPYASIANTLDAPVRQVSLTLGPALERGASKSPTPLPVSGYVAKPKTIGHFAYAVQWFLIGGTLLALWLYHGFRRGRAQGA